MLSKKAIRKHINIMKWWSDQPCDSHLWAKGKRDKSWRRVDEPDWLEDDIYVQGDYNENARKALVDGKNIIKIYQEVSVDRNIVTCKERAFEIEDGWKYLPETIFNLDSVKEGDWIINTKAGCTKRKSPFRAEKKWIEQRPGGNTKLTGDDTDFEFWEPKEGELAWYGGTLARHKKKAGELYIGEPVAMGVEVCANMESLEPFFGKLPKALETEEDIENGYIWG